MGKGSSKSVVAPTSDPTSPPSTDITTKTITRSEEELMRDQLLQHGLHPESWSYARRKLHENPEDSRTLAFLAETALQYERTKNIELRPHWIDRLDILDEGLAATSKCMRLYPENSRCVNFHVQLAVKAADQAWFIRTLKPLGPIVNFARIQKRGEQCLAQEPTAEVCKSLGGFYSRCAKPWYKPYRWIGWWYGVPDEKGCFEKAIEFHRKAKELDPEDLENVARLASAYYGLGDYANARKWYSYCRDEMVPREGDDIRWSSLAHTSLLTHFPQGALGKQDRSKWNVPFA